MPLQRLFVGNIPSGTTEQELRQEFESYGPVEAIDLKSKPNATNVDSLDTFAFINIELDDRTLRSCITEFRQQQYRGVYLNVSKAKESFLDRLKREREEAEAAKQSSGVLNPYKKFDNEPKPVEEAKPLPVLPTIKKKIESSSSESSSESEDEVPEPVRKAPSQLKEEDQLVRKWNQETYIEHGKLKIVPITGQVKEVIEKDKKKKQNVKDLDEKSRLADEKRKQGLTNLNSAYELQKSAIQAALAGGISVKRKKIVFDENGSEELGYKKAKISLFGNEDDEDGFKANFAVKKELSSNTENGQKLFEMQTQFQGDSRFKLDERFLADDGSAVGRSKKKMLDKEKASFVSGDNKANNQERKKQLEILSKVTGKNIQDQNQFRKEEPGGKSMQRFEPPTQNKVKKEKKLTEEDILETKRAIRPEDSFQVSEDKFYNVSDNLTQALGVGSSGGFSLLQMFGKAVSANSDNEEEAKPQVKSEKPVLKDTRFRYESSASEDEEDQQEQQVENVNNDLTVAQEDEAKKKKKKAGYFSKQGVWKENFFFLPNDARLEEGRKFFVEFAGSVGEANTEKDTQLQDIRKVFKKRRMRETKIVNQMRAKRGLKLMKRK
ncbi:probable RNA-binding protein CG14230 [Toxorhynchites rutilus septentrionalis]|uniref:probable RNA-binding protein CG14230 n=1 Tax=Toxorhynchites rutilus septentrionalis TaxID=329112 RepID=UPI0024793B34|nr:probable RNA-binding protein CG14230 [Toxorhynchites rutilus septentrionalis]